MVITAITSQVIEVPLSTDHAPVMETTKETHDIPSQPNPLTRALTANAAFSAASAIVLVAGASPLARWLDIPTWLSVAAGLGLALFAFDVGRTARRPTRTAVLAIIAADVAWVLGAAVLIVGFPDALSTGGLWALGLVSLAVADFAVVQTLVLRRLSSVA